MEDLTFENDIQKDLQHYLRSLGQMDERQPDCPDLDGKWEQIANAYLPDGIREFNAYPKVSLGWMMYVGMAMAKFWDEDWQIYANMADVYAYMRDKRGYDCLDEYVRGCVLGLRDKDYDDTEKLVAECASRVYNRLRHQAAEPGTPEAFRLYVACLHQLYLAGIAVQLYRLGYRMQLMQ
ncbi:MAG: hypothetical protein NC388_03320 [Clostridium sp.]|nr:hypothetical protein [Clostridium sp.]